MDASIDATATTLITLGALFLAGLAADVVGRRTRLPRITLLLMVGVCVGPLGFDLFPAAGVAWFPFIAQLALVMIAFLLGGELTTEALRDHGRAVLVASLVVVITTAGAVALGLAALGWPIGAAILLGAVSTSTDPVAVSDVAREVEARGPFAKTLLGIVAVDDAWGIAAMSLALAAVIGFDDPTAAGGFVWHGLAELCGALLVGVLLGAPIALLTGRIREGEPTQAEALGGVLLCGGIALWLEVSPLLAAMTMGAVVANLARHHTRPFRAIEGIEWPFMVLFFVLSGASLAVAEMSSVATLAAAYVLLRVLGRVLGGWCSGLLLGRDGGIQRVGIGLLPQAGVAIGMALVASQQLPELGDSILAATVSATILFELVGPVLTRWMLVRSQAEFEAMPLSRE